jgi:hypothetical protein
MAVDGQRDPIKVVAQPKNKAKPWRLVTGMHRLIGARLEGIQVFAIEVSGKPEDLADLEASENLHRRPLAPIERAKFTAALVQAAQDRIARENGNLKQQQLAVRARQERVKALNRSSVVKEGPRFVSPPWLQGRGSSRSTALRASCSMSSSISCSPVSSDRTWNAPGSRRSPSQRRMLAQSAKRCLSPRDRSAAGGFQARDDSGIAAGFLNSGRSRRTRKEGQRDRRQPRPSTAPSRSATSL